MKTATSPHLPLLLNQGFHGCPIVWEGPLKRVQGALCTRIHPPWSSDPGHYSDQSRLITHFTAMKHKEKIFVILLLSKIGWWPAKTAVCFGQSGSAALLTPGHAGPWAWRNTRPVKDAAFHCEPAGSTNRMTHWGVNQHVLWRLNGPLLLATLAWVKP